MARPRKSAARILAALAALYLALSPARAETCGAESAPCLVPLGSYHTALPAPRADGAKRPAVLYFHGAGGSGASITGANSYLRPFVDAGYVLIGANGMIRPGNAFGSSWAFRPDGPQYRDELAFAKEVLADVEARFSIDRARVLVTGFSIGGSLAWYLACKEPGLAAAYAPLAGGFWRPHPKACAGPVDLLHTHGWRDMTVPLEGRPLRGGEIHQGDIFEGLQVWRAANGCKGVRPDAFEMSALLWQRAWTRCESGRELRLALYPSDHDDIPKEWPEFARLWFEARLKARSLQ